MNPFLDLDHLLATPNSKQNQTKKRNEEYMDPYDQDYS